MRRILIILVFGLNLMACGSHLPPLQGHVVDDARLLSQEQRQSLEQRLSEHQQLHHHQIVVVSLYSMEGERIEKIAARLSEGWEIGKMLGYRGVLLLVAPREQQLYIHVGVGLRPILDDQAVQAIIDGQILPVFAQGKLDQGIEQGVTAILARLEKGSVQ